jgi:hypothetical protein
MNNDLSAEELAFRYIKMQGGRVHVSTVIDYVLERKPYAGQTPRKTVCSIIQRSPRISCKNRYCSISQ